MRRAHSCRRDGCSSKNPCTHPHHLQVHKARLAGADGAWVAVKVQHAGVEAMMRSDLANMRLFTDLADRHVSRSPSQLSCMPAAWHLLPDTALAQRSSGQGWRNVCVRRRCGVQLGFDLGSVVREYQLAVPGEFQFQREAADMADIRQLLSQWAGKGLPQLSQACMSPCTSFLMPVQCHCRHEQSGDAATRCQWHSERR